MSFGVRFFPRGRRVGRRVKSTRVGDGGIFGLVTVGPVLAAFARACRFEHDAMASGTSAASTK